MRYILLMISALFCLATPPALAQDGNVEINLDVLEELNNIYSAPQVPAVRKTEPLRAPVVKTLTVTTRPNSRIINPPIPQRRPAVLNAPASFIEKARSDFENGGPFENAAPEDAVSPAPQRVENPKTIVMSLPEDKQAAASAKTQPLIPQEVDDLGACLLYTSPSPRDQRGSRMPSSA